MGFSVLLEKLSRVTVSQKFIPEIDGLRFISIASVVLFHLRTHILRTCNFDAKELAGDAFFSILSAGGLGVNIFFTISGFILALPFARHYLTGSKKVELGSYYVRRLTRLEPPYIIIMTILFITQVVFFSNPLSELLPHYAASLAYVHFFVYGAWSVINPVAWSLETEVQFYILAPFLAWVIYQVTSRSLRMLGYIVSLLGYYIFLYFNYDVLVELNLYKSVLFYLPHFWLGFLLADCYLIFQNRVSDKGVIFDGLGVAGIVGIFYFYTVTEWVNSFLFLISTVLLFLGVFKGTLLNYFFTRRVVTVIGGMCYTIYLIHYGFIYVVTSLFGNIIPVAFYGFHLTYIVIGLAVIPMLLICSAVVFYFVERPFMYPRWYSKLRPSS